MNGKMPSHKEAEVDVLTDLLVQSMDNNQDIDSYGMVDRRFIDSLRGRTNQFRKNFFDLQVHVSNVVNVLSVKIPVVQLWSKFIT